MNDGPCAVEAGVLHPKPVRTRLWVALHIGADQAVDVVRGTHLVLHRQGAGAGDVERQACPSLRRWGFRRTRHEKGFTYHCTHDALAVWAE